MHLWQLVGLSVFLLSMIGLYAASTAYHAFHLTGERDRLLKKLDHAMIFVLIAGTSQRARVEEILNELPVEETLLIYSSWEGYYTVPEQIAANLGYRKFRELFSNVVDIHTSGHADKETIKRVIDIVKPLDTIVIHKESGTVL